MDVSDGRHGSADLYRGEGRKTSEYPLNRRLGVSISLGEEKDVITMPEIGLRYLGCPPQTLVCLENASCSKVNHNTGL
jgi:hypothetical protein